jgi:hypothetical protein
MVVMLVVDVGVGAEGVCRGLGIAAVGGVEIMCNGFGYFYGVICYVARLN